MFAYSNATHLCLLLWLYNLRLSCRYHDSLLVYLSVCKYPFFPKFYFRVCPEVSCKSLQSQIIVHYMNILHLVNSSVHGHVGSFHFLDTMPNATVNICA